jgi:hypothetical protein
MWGDIMVGVVCVTILWLISMTAIALGFAVFSLMVY